MKKITFLIFAMFTLTFSWQSSAQFTESFETEIPATWTIINNGSSNGWEQYGSPTGGAQDGTSVARIVYDSSIAHDDYLITPGINVTAGVNDRLSYYIKSRSSTFLEPYEVLLSTSGTNQGDFTEILQASSEAPASWTLNEFDLSAYTGQTVYVAIHATGTNEWELYVDNVVNDVLPTDTLDYYNIQWPPNGTISSGESFMVFAQCWEGGLTDASSSPAAGIEAWIGYSTADTDPSTAGWTWIEATPNPGYDFNSNNDEYQLDLGVVVTTAGTYYYASRWSLNNGPYTYGGINGGGNGDWATYGSGMLVVNAPTNIDCANAEEAFEGSITGTFIYDATTGTNNGDSAWFYYTATADGTLNINSCSGGADTRLFIFDACGGAEIASDDDTCDLGDGDEYASEVEFPVTNGTTYYIQWDDRWSLGPFDWSITFIACTSAIINSTTIIDDCANSQFSVDIDVTSLGDATSITDGTDTWPISAGTVNVGPFSVSDTVSLSIVHSNSDCDFSLGDFSFVCPPANDDCSGAIMLIPGVVYNDNPVDGTVVGATSDAEANSCGSNGSGVWYSVVVPNDGNITIETGPDAATGNTAFDSVIEVFSGSCGSLVSIDCDDDGAATGNFSLLELSGLVSGETIYLRVWEYLGDETEPFSISAYSGTLSTDDLNNENLFSYYPNPVKNALTLSAQKTIENISVVNMLGQEVLTVAPNSFSNELDMSNLSNGSYFVRVTVGGVTETVRIVKQ